MTAPNTQTTSLARSLADFNPDGLLEYAKVTAAGAANATISAANLVNGILTCTQAANITLTTDTGANIANQIGPQPVGACFEFSIMANAAANTVVTLAGGTGITINTTTTVANGVGQSWRMVQTGNQTFTAYPH